MGQSRLGVLDGLRGIAVLLVVWYHLWQLSWLPAPLPSLQFIPETGFEGVDLFFFISGFVIAYPFITSLLNGDPEPTWAHFAYRRALKIVPSYLLSIVVVIAIGYAHFSGTAQALRDIVTHLLFVHTWSYDTYGSINGVLWTLGVEVQFYLLFPLLWLAFKHYPWLTAGAITAISLLYRVHAAQCCAGDWMQLLVFNLPGYLDIFAAGMISALLYVRWRDAKSRWVAPLSTLTAAAGFVLFGALLHDLWSTRSAGQWFALWQVDHRTLVALAFVLITVGSLLAAGAWKRAIASPPLLFLSAISYNLYLYHQVIARTLFTWAHGDVRVEGAQTFAAFAVCIAAAALVTYVFERPLLMSRKAVPRALSEG